MNGGGRRRPPTATHRFSSNTIEALQNKSNAAIFQHPIYYYRRYAGSFILIKNDSLLLKTFSVLNMFVIPLFPVIDSMDMYIILIVSSLLGILMNSPG